MYYLKGEVDQLVTAALDQPHPTHALAAALNAMLARHRHPLADMERSLDRDLAREMAELRALAEGNGVTDQTG